MATTYEWVRHLTTNPSYFTGITESVANPFGVYVTDPYFGVRKTVNPRPTADGIYYWKTTIDRGTIGVCIEWEYRVVTVDGVTTRTLWARSCGGAWTDQTAQISGMPSGVLILDSVFDTAGLNPLSTDFVEQDFVGAADAAWEYRENGGLITSGSGSFDIRALAIQNLRADKVKFNPVSDENTTTIKGDIMALPASTSLFPNGWEPTDDVDWTVLLLTPEGYGKFIQGQTLTSEDVIRTLTGVSAVSASNGTGLVARVEDTVVAGESVWNGLDEDDKIVESLVVFPAQALAPVPTTGTTFSRIKESFVIAYRDRCCEQLGSVSTKGNLNLAFSADMLDSPVGQSFGDAISYHSFQQEALPASLGYGWSSKASARIIFNLPNSNDIVYKSEGGRFARWREDSGSYIPLHDDNYIELQTDAMDPDATYTLTFKDQTRREFNSNGQLRREVDRNGNTITYSYISGVLDSVTDGFGRSLHYTFRGDGQPSSIRALDPSTGRQVQFEYYGSADPVSPDRLKKIIDPEGESTEFVYYSSGLLKEVKDTAGNVATAYTYDSLGRVTTETVYDQMRRFYFYNELNFLESSVEVQEIDLIGNEDDRISLYVYDRRSNIVTTVDVVELATSTFNVTFMEYEDSVDPYLLTKRTDPNGATTELTYTSDGNLKTVTNAQERTTIFFYPEEVDTLPINPKHRNLVRKIQRPDVTVDGLVESYPATEFTYDGNGNLETIIDAKGKVTTFELDSLTGQVLGVTDRRWDGNLANQAAHTTVFGYHSTTRNLLTIQTPGGPNGAPSRTYTFDYDDHDNVISVEDPLGNTWAYEFDDNDRTTKIIDARSKIVNFEYLDGLLDFIDAPANEGSGSRRKTFYEYDSSRRLERINSEVSSSAQQMRARFEYSGFSQLKKLARLMNSVEKSTSYSYDPLGRQTAMTDPLNRTSVVDHAPFCTEFTETTARGVSRKYSLDTLCRLTVVETTSEDHEYFYDELDRLVRVVQFDKRPRYGQSRYGQDRYGGAETRTFLYDELDRLVKVTFEAGETILYEYDAESNLTKLTDVHGNVTRYEYYNDNRLYKVIVERPSQADRVFTYSYDLAGRLAQIEYPAETGIVARFDDGATPTPNPGWNANGQLTHLRYLKNGAHLHSFEYDYDDAGNRKLFIDTPQNTANAIRWEYSYDWLNRLAEVKRGDGGATPMTVSLYAYDESDNRIELSMPVLDEVHTYTYNAADEIVDRSVAVGAGLPVVMETFSHDLDGNMTGRVLDPDGTPQSTAYTWNEFDRLIRIATPSQITSNSYDTGGIRKKATTDELALKSFYSGLPTLTETEEASGNATSFSYLMGHRLLGFEKNSEFFYFILDGLGSVRVLTSSTGAEAAAYVHDESGQRVTVSETSASSRKTFVGGLSVTDAVTSSGLLYMWQRWYNPSAGRFLKRDPLGFRGGLNLYLYADNNPVNFVDPFGLDSGSGLQGDMFENLSFSPEALNLIDRGIATIRGLGFEAEANELQRQRDSGELRRLPVNPWASGFTNPLTKNIGIQQEYCLDSRYGPNQQSVNTTSLLFHEATHALSQRKGTLLAKGVAAYGLRNPVAERDLELPVYTAEREFLKNWHSQSGQYKTAIENRIIGVNQRINEMERAVEMHHKRSLMERYPNWPCGF